MDRDEVWRAIDAERVSLGGFCFAATDCSWSAGDGLLVEGPIGAILLLLTGRPAGLAQLSGPGARELSAVGLGQDELVAGAGTDTGRVRDK